MISLAQQKHTKHDVCNKLYSQSFIFLIKTFMHDTMIHYWAIQFVPKPKPLRLWMCSNHHWKSANFPLARAGSRVLRREAARETRETSASRSVSRGGECRACTKTTEIDSRVTLEASPMAPARAQAKSQQHLKCQTHWSLQLLFKRPFSNAETDRAFGPVPRDFPAVVKTLMGGDC